MPEPTPQDEADPGPADDAELAFWRSRCGARLAERYGNGLAWSRACPPKLVPDDAAKIVLQSPAGEPLGVLVGSASAAPDMAARHARRSRAAAEALPAELAAVVLKPDAEGEVDGRSFVVWPYRKPAADGRLAQWRWRRRMAGPVADWLFRVTKATRRSIPAGEVGPRLSAPLSALSTFPGLSGRVTAAVAEAQAAFDAGRAEPVQVLMHNDLWTGNVLSPGRDSDSGPFRFTIIDWAGAETGGYPVYDLARWAQSVRWKPGAYRRALLGYAGVLGCGTEALGAHLMVSLGFLAQHLEGFPPQRFVRLADDCVGRLDAALGDRVR